MTLRIVSDGVEHAETPFKCSWCNEMVSLGDSYWSAYFEDMTSAHMVHMQICRVCSLVGPDWPGAPTLEDVLP